MTKLIDTFHPHPDGRMNWEHFSRVIPFELTIEQEVKVRHWHYRPVTQLATVMEPDFIHDDWSRDAVLGMLLAAKKFNNWCGIADSDLPEIIHNFYGQYFTTCQYLLRMIVSRPPGSDIHADFGEIEGHALRWHLTVPERRCQKIIDACARLRKEQFLFVQRLRPPSQPQINAYYPTRRFQKIFLAKVHRPT